MMTPPLVIRTICTEFPQKKSPAPQAYSSVLGPFSPHPRDRRFSGLFPRLDTFTIAAAGSFGGESSITTHKASQSCSSFPGPPTPPCRSTRRKRAPFKGQGVVFFYTPSIAVRSCPLFRFPLISVSARITYMAAFQSLVSPQPLDLQLEASYHVPRSPCVVR